MRIISSKHLEALSVLEVYTTDIMGMFEYIAVLTSIIIGLGIAQLLRGAAGLVQQPDKTSIYWVHLCWVGYMFFTLVFWWWWEFRLSTIEIWTFDIYLFVVFYALTLFLVCALLFPVNLEGYKGYKGYFYSIRVWLFGLLALTYAIDLIDSLIKGYEYFMSLGPEYLITSVAQFSLCVVAMWTSNERYHAVFAISMLVYQISWAMRIFDTLV
jgi:hypothetical protein